MDITPDIQAWMMTPVGIAALASLAIQGFKSRIKSDDGSLWVNIWTMVLCFVFSGLTVFASAPFTNATPLLLVGKTVISFGLATGGYEVVKNILPKKA